MADCLPRPADWGSLCAILSRCRLAPLAYQRLANAGAAVPEDVADWLRSQYEHTARSNRLLLQELHVINRLLLKWGIPILVMKGPVLAHIGVGEFTRTYHDLDVLVQTCHLSRATEALRTLGFIELPEASHGFHQTFARMRPGRWPSIAVELHFDLADNGGPYAPNPAGVWSRSVGIEINGRVVRCPELTDHLLLTIMQLPHHGWDLRLVLDIAHVVHKHRAAIDWEQMIQRANAWEIRALVGSALYTTASLFNVPLPAIATAFAEPKGYVQRVQWRIVRQAALDQLSPFAADKIVRIAPFLVVDRLRAMKYLIRRAVLRMPGQQHRGDPVAAALRRIVTGLSTLPSLISVAARAAVNDHT